MAMLKTSTRGSLVVAGFLAATTLCGAQTTGAEYPNKPIKLVVPVATGGLTDILARMLAQRLQERLGQPVVVDNKPGGGGIVAMNFTAKAPADGYTLVMGYPGALVVNQSLYKSMPYDAVKDLAPVSGVAAWPLVLITNPSVPAKSVQELVALLKSQPGKLSYASGGNTTTGHLAMELFRSQTGTHMVHIPYRGAGPAMTDLIGGQVGFSFDSLALAAPQVQTGKIRVLGISTAKRSPLAPDIPTLAESGLPNFEVTGWYGIVAPAGTPKPIIDKLSREFVAIVNEPAMRDQLAAKGIEPMPMDTAQFTRFLQDETKKWHKVVIEAGIKVDQ